MYLTWFQRVVFCPLAYGFVKQRGQTPIFTFPFVYYFCFYQNWLDAKALVPATIWHLVLYRKEGKLPFLLSLFLCSLSIMLHKKWTFPSFIFIFFSHLLQKKIDFIWKGWLWPAGIWFCNTKKAKSHFPPNLGFLTPALYTRWRQ